MSRRYVCKRRSCARPRQKWEHLCSSCWSRVPADLRALIVRAGKANHFDARDAYRRAAIDVLDGKRAWSDPHARAIAAITGDRDMAEAAE